MTESPKLFEEVCFDICNPFYFPGNYDEEERDDGQVDDPYGGGGGGGRGGADSSSSSGGYEDGYTYGRTRDPCEGVDCPPVYWDVLPHHCSVVHKD